MNQISSKSPYPWIMLIIRLVLFALVQALIAGIFWLAGTQDAWEEAARWWLFGVIVTNAITILLLVRLFRREGQGFLDVFRFRRESLWMDLAISIGGLLLTAPVAVYPSIALAERFFGSNEVPVGMMFRPIPTWAVLVGLLFPVTIAFAELPNYFGYAMPRLEGQLGNGWLAWVLASLALSLQHVTLPLILDGRFILWRALMFLPLALYLGLLLKIRPRLLPYMAIGHFLIDLLALSTYLSM
jgi:hypothetical protein